MAQRKAEEDAQLTPRSKARKDLEFLETEREKEKKVYEELRKKVKNSFVVTFNDFKRNGRNNKRTLKNIKK